MKLIACYLITIIIVITPITLHRHITKIQFLKSATSKEVAYLSAYALLILFTFTIQYVIWGLNYDNITTHDILDALYFSIVTWTTLGYGDFQPSTEIRLLASFQALTGYIFMAVSIANLIETYRNEKKELFEKPLKTQIIDQAMACLHTVSSSILHSIGDEKGFRSSIKDTMARENNNQIQKFNFLVNMHKEVLSATLLLNIHNLIKNFQTLGKVSDMNFQREKFKNPTFTHNPINIMKDIEKTIIEMGRSVGHSPSDSRPETVRAESLNNIWKKFKQKNHIIDSPEEIEIKKPTPHILMFDKSFFFLLR